MAHLTASRLRAQDNSGNAVALATLRVYEAGTTTPAELYSTAALAAAGGDGDLPNPVTSNSAGYFPAIFLGENVTVDLICEDSAGNDLWQANGVQGVPGGLDDIAVDLGDDGRFRVMGEGGLVQMEFGDPTGDDSGGDGRIGGWAGTQGSELEVDFAEVTFTGDQTTQGNAVVEGTFTFDGGQTVDLLIREGEQTTAGSGVIELGTGYNIWEVDVFDLIPGAVASSSLRFQLSFDGGATYLSTNEYKWHNLYVTTAATGNPAGYVELTDINYHNGGLTPANFRIVITDHGETLPTTFYWDGVTFNNTPFPFRVIGGGATTSGFGTPTHLKVLRASGTHSYRYIVKARRRRSA